MEFDAIDMDRDIDSHFFLRIFSYIKYPEDCLETTVENTGMKVVLEKF